MNPTTFIELFGFALLLFFLVLWLAVVDDDEF